MKKNIFIFIAGMITTILLEFIFLVFIGVSNELNGGYPGLTIFEKEGACINAKQIKIFQTLEPNMALAHALTKPNAIYDENETLVLIIGDENTHYYDNQVITVPKGKLVKQVGVYQYPTERGYNTVPVVAVFGWERSSK
jgi:hypothetical protein